MFSWMASTKTPGSIFVCNECGTVERKWHGQCPGCAQWNTLVEEAAPTPSVGKGARRGIGGARESSDTSETESAFRGTGLAAVPAPKARSPRAPIVEPVILSEVRAARIRRIPTGIGEFDRVLGGSDAVGLGLVPGSLVLLGGAPGIGKSTL